MTASLSSRPAAMLVINACAVLLAFAAVLFDGRAANAQTQDTFDRIVREKKSATVTSSPHQAPYAILRPARSPAFMSMAHVASPSS